MASRCCDCARPAAAELLGLEIRQSLDQPLQAFVRVGKLEQFQALGGFQRQPLGEAPAHPGRIGQVALARA